jgi:hypothetical protein
MIAILLLFTFLGCSTKIKKVYIKTPCPKLQQFEVDKNATKVFFVEFGLSVPSNQMIVSVPFNDLIRLSIMMQDTKRVGRELLKKLELYERMIDEYNSSIKKQ